MSCKLKQLLALGLAAAFTGGAAIAADTAPMTAMNMYGGPVYAGAPALTVTAALVKAGGGAGHFSLQHALVSMLGKDTVNAEVAKLTKQYGKQNVSDWINGFDYAVADGLTLATKAGVKLPAAPQDLAGAKLAGTLVDAGSAPDGTFWSGLVFDKALSHDIHNQVMVDIETKYSTPYDKNLHAITNQAMYDVGQALGKKQTKLASLH
ncbi:MAG: hypothetical protein ACHQAZ_04195 [Gammaproteobacteria bacterium]